MAVIRLGKADEWAAYWDCELSGLLDLRPDELRPEGEIKPAERTDLAWNAIKINSLLPEFKIRFWEYAQAVDSVAGAHGVDYIIWCGMRSVPKQLQLYRQGRTTPGKIVTRIMFSRHLVGAAIDWCVRTPAGQPSFSLPQWHRDVLALARPHGLRSLLLERGMDPPHVEVPDADMPRMARAILDTMRRTFPGLAP